jgi:hypothetical protein
LPHEVVPLSWQLPAPSQVSWFVCVEPVQDCGLPQ